MNSPATPETTPPAPAGLPCGTGPSQEPTRPEMAWPTWLCALAPALLLLTMLTGAIHVRMALGRWPNFNDPIPSAGWPIHQFAIIWSLVTSAFVAFPVWVLLLCFGQFRGSRQLHTRQALVFLTCWAAVLLWCYFDPGKLIYWFND